MKTWFQAFAFSNLVNLYRYTAEKVVRVAVLALRNIAEVGRCTLTPPDP
jgi:hypothetical protein